MLFFLQFFLILIDLCLTLPCGVNANCTTDNGKHSCSCPQKMVGDPKVKCEGIHIIFS